jgi:aspartate/methionine/tyrosine aminotransferase
MSDRPPTPLHDTPLHGTPLCTTRPSISERSRVQPFLAMAMGELGEQHLRRTGSLLALHVGQPSSGAPLTARQAAAAAILEPGALGYTTSYGLPTLRQRIAQHYNDWYGVAPDPNQILITAGASGAFVVTFLACFDAGARVAITAPGYPCYRNDLRALGIEPVEIEVGPDTRWAPTPAMLDEANNHKPLDGLIVASPANPTGTIIAPDDLRALTTWCKDHNVTMISDEIYHGITYTGDGTQPDTQTSSAVEYSNDVVVINSFSKYFAMTGWRLGWILGPPDVIEACERLQGNLSICAPHVSQVAGLAAFDAGQELHDNVAAFARKRQLIISGLTTAGITSFAPPDGAFYIYADVSHLVPEHAPDSLALCKRWLEELDVLATPGTDFDLRRGTSTVRFSFAGPEPVIEEACRRLATWNR